MPRRRNCLVVISWRDIPAQVNWGSGEEKQAVVLPRRFQKAIDDAAMVADKKTASEYVGEWRRDLIQFEVGPDGIDGIARAQAQRLEDAFPPERLARFVATGGYDPDATAPGS